MRNKENGESPRIYCADFEMYSYDTDGDIIDYSIEESNFLKAPEDIFRFGKNSKGYIIQKSITDYCRQTMNSYYRFDWWGKKGRIEIM